MGKRIISIWFNITCCKQNYFTTHAYNFLFIFKIFESVSKRKFVSLVDIFLFVPNFFLLLFHFYFILVWFLFLRIRLIIKIYILFSHFGGRRKWKELCTIFQNSHVAEVWLKYVRKTKVRKFHWKFQTNRNRILFSSFNNLENSLSIKNLVLISRTFFVCSIPGKID